MLIVEYATIRIYNYDVPVDKINASLQLTFWVEMMPSMFMTSQWKYSIQWSQHVRAVTSIQALNF